MPTHLTLPLHAAPDAPFPATPHRALMGALYRWLEAAYPALAAGVHDLPGPKPFTVAPLSRREDSRPEEGLVFTCALLDDALWPPLEAALRRGATVAIGDDRWPVLADGWRVEQRSYPELVVESGLETRLAFRFCSPTSFRSQEMHYPLPDPVLVFQSWLGRWNAYAPESLRLNVNTLDLVAAHVAISRHHLRTVAVRFDRYTQVGFVGGVAYQVVKPRLLGDDLLRRLNILAAYAPYCGTGHKTTQGMGWTERV